MRHHRSAQLPTTPPASTASSEPIFAAATSPLPRTSGFAAAAALLLAALLTTAATLAGQEASAASLRLSTGEDGEFLEAPILASVVHVEASGLVAHTTLTQLFLHSGDETVDAVYSFALPEGAAVDGMRLVVGERVIEATIQERAAAVEIYREAAAQGQKAGLLEQATPGAFTTAVANLLPGDLVEVTLELHHEVRYEVDRFSLRLPTLVAPRYAPQLPEPASEDLPGPSVLRGASVAAGDFGVRVDLAPGFPLAWIDSPSHELTVAPQPGGQFRIELADGAAPADGDFVLQWAPLPGAQPQALAYRQEVDGEQTVLLMVLPPATLPADARTAREAIFVIDTSGSMEGEALEQAKRALVSALASLTPSDRFNVIRFSSQEELLFPGSLPADPVYVAEASRWVAALEVNGGTEMLPALEAALADPATPGFLRQVVFITDGQVTGEAALLSYIRTWLGTSRLFTVGIGAAPNGSFMRRAATAGRGTFTFIRSLGEVEEKIAGLLARLEAPALTDVMVDGGPGWRDALPDPIPDLYLGEPLVVAARTDGRSRRVEISGWRGEVPWRATVDLPSALPAAGVGKLWAQRQVEALTDALSEGASGQAVRAQVVELGLRYRLVTPYTSFVAVDPEVTAPARDFNPGVQECIVVTSESPLLDARRVAVGTTVAALQLDAIPSARDPWTVISSVPGMLVDRTEAGASPAPAVARYGDGRTPLYLDGVELAHATSRGASPSYYDFSTLEEMHVLTGGADVRSSEAGGRIELVTRRGTSWWRGDADAHASGTTLQSSSRPAADELAAGQEPGPQAQGNRLQGSRTTGAGAGGPLVRDRLWLWATARRSSLDRIAFDGGRHAGAATAGSLKINAQPSASSSAVAYVRRAAEEEDGLGAHPRRARETTWHSDGRQDLGKLELTVIASASFYTTGQLDAVEQQHRARPLAGLTAAPVVDAGGVARQGFFATDDDGQATGGHLDGAWFFTTGDLNHELHFGLDHRRDEGRGALAVPGDGVVVTAGQVYGLPAGRAVAAVWRDGAPGHRSVEETVWLQDQLGGSRLTLTAGLRLDRRRLEALPGSASPSPFDAELLPAVSFAGAEVADWTSLAPRLGLSWSLGQERDTLLRASLARFADRPEPALSRQLDPTSPATAWYLFTDADGDLSLDPEEQAGLDFLAPLGFDPARPPGSAPGTVDPDLGPELTDEVVVSLERALRSELVVGLSLTHRRRHELLEERLLVRDASGAVRPAERTDWRPAGVVAGRLPDGTPYQAAWFDLVEGLSPTGGRQITNGDRRQELSRATLFFTKLLRSRVMARGHLSLSDSRWQLGSEFRRFDDPTPLLGSGDVDGDRVAAVASQPLEPLALVERAWALHLEGLVELPRRLRLALAVDARDGDPLPYSRSVLRPADGPAEVRLTEGLATYRAADLFTVDLGIDRSFELGDATVSLRLDAFNLFDERTILRRATDLGLTRGDFAESSLPPRTLRLGVRLSWD